MTTRVVIVGGGYGGFNVAKQLDDVADVVLVERKDAFVHNVAALRAAVAPDWAGNYFLPYDRLLQRGRVVQDRAVLVRPGEIALAREGGLAADYIVLATGYHVPVPGQEPREHGDRVTGAYVAIQASLAAAGRILLVGAGPVGLEMAGEITSKWPDKHVTIIEAADHILSGAYRDALRDELTAQLTSRGVELLLGSGLTATPSHSPGGRAVHRENQIWCGDPGGPVAALSRRLSRHGLPGRRARHRPNVHRPPARRSIPSAARTRPGLRGRRHNRTR